MNIEQCKRAIALHEALATLEQLQKVVCASAGIRLQMQSIDENDTIEHDLIIPGGFYGVVFDPLRSAMEIQLRQLGIER